jgi:subfamily B ATP-binding cassette protein MsbA
VILWFAIRQSAGGQYGAGDFITYMAALLHLLNQLKTLSNVNSVVQRGLTAAVFALIDEARTRHAPSRQPRRGGIRRA